MDLNGHHRKWPTAGRRWQHLERILILFASMSAFSLMMIINIDISRYNNNNNGDGNTLWWAGDLILEDGDSFKDSLVRQMAMPAMKTIVAYSAEMQVEMDRKYPVLCKARRKNKESVQKEETWLSVGESGVSLYAAYYDDRIADQPFTRILAITSGSNKSKPLYCQTGRKEEKEDIFESVEATVTEIWWSEWDPTTPNTVTPILISCALKNPRDETYTTAVTTNPCELSSTVLEVKHSNSNKFERNFTVCVKDMNFNVDNSERLIEWFELLKILGAEHFHVYVTNITKEASGVLDYYSNKGIASIHKSPRLTASFLWQRRRDHLLAYNDCLYRNLKTSRYIIPLDVDEMIVPREAKTWREILQVLQPLENEAPGAASLAVSNAFFFDSFNNESNDNVNIYKKSVDLAKKEFHPLPHTLRHLRRSSLISPVPEYSKSFVSTTKALTVFNHYALAALSGAERARAVPEDIALLHHYKSLCEPALVDCHLYSMSSVEDDTLMNVSSDLLFNINRVLNEI